jgi:hypothetical protein
MPSDTYVQTALLMRGQQISQMIHAAAELGIADPVGEGRDVGELAAEVGAVPEKLQRLLRAMSAFGLFAVDADGRVTHTERSSLLRSDSVPTLHYAARFWGMPSMWATWGELVHTLRTGEPAFVKANGMANWDYRKTHADEGRIFDEFMQHSPDDRHAAVAEAYDFAAAKVVDVGGGNGGLLAAILGRHPGTTGILADREWVVAAAAAVFGPLGARCAVVPTDFFAAVPGGGNVYTLAQILHDWADEPCRDILRNVRAAIGPDGRVLIIEQVLDDDPQKQDILSLLTDMQMMALFPGARERTVSEYAALLADAGFGPPRLIGTRSAFSILESRPN